MPKNDDGKTVDSEILAKWSIGENLVMADLGGVTDKRMTGLYKSRANIRAGRVGYTVLSAVSYKTHQQSASFCLPLPDSISVMSDYSWSEQAEEGFADLASRAAENSGQARGNAQAVSETAARSLVGMVKDNSIAQAFMRHTGVAYNPNNQMYFQGPSFSSVPYTFKLVPKSKNEAIVMYESIKTIVRMTSPGGAGEGVLGVLKKGLDSMMSVIAPGGTQGEQQPTPEQIKQSQAEAAKVAQQAAASQGIGHISSAQPAFFTYPPLWDVAFFVPSTDAPAGFRKLLEWKRLACESVRLDLGSDVKWHKDGYPVTISMTLQLKETILRTASTMYQTMPVIIS